MSGTRSYRQRPLADRLIDNPPGEPRATSTLVNGYFPKNRALLVVGAAVLGFLLTVVWSATFADQTIGDTVADNMLGHNAKTTPIAGIGAGILFAFVSGLAGSFTACNVAAFGAVAPLLGAGAGRAERLRRTLTPLAWLGLGSLVVAALYGALVGLVGTDMPQFSTARPTPGHLVPVLTQSMIVFGVLGVVMAYLGLAALGYLPDPFARVARRYPNAPMIFIGALIGAFQIGRPFPLFREMFRHAADSGNPLYGAAAFMLQAVGNVLIMTVIFLALTLLLTGRIQRWLAGAPSRISAITAVSMIAAGVFLVLYWDVRLLAVLKIIAWYPLAPWV
jgi:MFS family permease